MDVYDQLPYGLQFAGASGASCSVSVSNSAGQLLKCTTAGGLPSGGSTGFKISVIPADSLLNAAVRNSARVDVSGANAVQSPAGCSADGAPAGCAMTAALTVQPAPAPVLSLGLSTTGLIANSIGVYTVSLSNSGSGSSGSSLVFYAQLPAQVAYNGVAINNSGTVSGVGEPVCVVMAGSAADGPLLRCTLSLPAGGVPPGGQTRVDLQVTPAFAAIGQTLPHRARVDPSGANAVQNPADCVANGAPAGCAVLRYALAGRYLSLSKSNPAALALGVSSSYSLLLSNLGNLPTSTRLTVYDQLPPHLLFEEATSDSAGTVVPSGLSCSASGTLAIGQQLACSLTLPAGGLPPGGSVGLQIRVRPQLAALGMSVINKAAVDPAGGDTVPVPADCTAIGSPAGCAVTPLLPVRGATLTLGVISPGPGSYVFSGNNGWVSQTIPVTVGNQLTQGAAQALISAAVTTLNLQPGGGGYIADVRCSGLGSGANAGQVSFTSSSFQLDAKATADGNAISCVVRMGQGYSLSLTKISVGGMGRFSFSGNNGWVTQTLQTTASGTPVSGPAQALLQPGTALRITESAPAGWSMTQVSCLDQNAAASGNPTSLFQPPITSGNTFELPPSLLRSAAVWVCTVTNSDGGETLNGQVILDNGSNPAAGGVAHDGVLNGGGRGHAGVSLRLTDCGKTVYGSAITDGSGLFALSTGNAPEGPVCLVHSLPAGYVSVSFQPGNTAGSYDRATQTLRFMLAAHTAYSGLLFGEVALSQLLGDGAQQVMAGQSVVYGHTFVAGTSASVVFASSEQPSADTDRWSSVLYADANCNGRLDAGDGVLSGAVSVQPGQQLCLLLKVSSPAGLAAGARNLSTLQALETYQPAPVWGVWMNRLTRVDVSTIGAAQGGNLNLLKQVRRVASCPSTGADTLPFATTNQAQPGQYVEYQLVYSNLSAGPLTAIRLSDSVPAYTRYRSAACGAVPAGLQGCTLVKQPAVGGVGSLLWELADAPATASVVGLQPGGSGVVVFCVQIQD